MIMIEVLKNKKGVALPVVLIVMLLLLALGAAAMMMSNLGYSSLASDTRYQYAEKAADAGLNDAVSRVLPTALCPSPGSGSVGNASYSFFTINDTNYTNCFVYSTGTFSNAKVVKVTVVPRAGTDWAALRTLGGTINLSGSSAIAGCDDDESAYADRCGVVSAIIYSGNLSYQPSDVDNPLINCTGEGSLKGFEGNPPLQSVPTPTQEELLSRYFNAISLSDLMQKIEDQKQIDFYPNLPTSASIQQTGISACNYTGGAACQTTSSTNIRCGSGSGQQDINLNTCNTVYVNGTLTIAHQISGKEIRVANGVNLNANLSNSKIISSGNINFSTSGTVNINNSILVSGGTINAGGTGNARYSGTIENSDLFANTLNFNLSTQSEIRGGIFYAKNGGVNIDTQGALNFGTITNPVLLLSEGTSAISMPGNFTFNGFIYTNATTINITGAVELQGMIVDASTNSTINNTGNGTIQFQKRVLDNLFNNLKTSFGGTPLLRQPECGAGNKGNYLKNTKVTVY